MSRLSPVNQARWARFRHNRRGYWSLWIFLVLFGLSMCSELIANDKPLLVQMCIRDRRTFREQFGLELPRSTYEQQETGKSVSRTNLRTGDLVLFRAGSTGRHVGIYIGNNQFVHASTSSGVIISSMNEPYWKKRYNEARRVLSRS